MREHLVDRPSRLSAAFYYYLRDHCVNSVLANKKGTVDLNALFLPVKREETKQESTRSVLHKRSSREIPEADPSQVAEVSGQPVKRQNVTAGSFDGSIPAGAARLDEMMTEIPRRQEEKVVEAAIPAAVEKLDENKSSLEDPLKNQETEEGGNTYEFLSYPNMGE